MRAHNNYDLNPLDENGQGIARSWNTALGFQEHNFTWEHAVRVLRKHLRFALVLCCVLTGLMGLYLLVQKDFYKPTARLEIAPPDSGINTLHEIESRPEEVENQDYLETQVQILSSDALAVSVIRELSLDHNSEFVSDEKLKEAST